MPDDPRAVFARLPAYTPHHPIKMKDLRIQWDQGCSKILQDAHLSADQKVKVVMDWLQKAGPGVRDFALGKMVLSFARPKPIPATDEQRTERRQKALVRMAYNDAIPHLRAVNKIVTQRLDTVPADTSNSLAQIDALDDRETENPGTMFAEFVRSVEAQSALEYNAIQPSGAPFADAAE